MTKTKTFEIAFTAFVVALIVFPIPPSTIIGVALATNKRTGRYMNQHAFVATQRTMRFVGSTITVPAAALAKGRQISAEQRIRQRTVRL